MVSNSMVSSDNVTVKSQLGGMQVVEYKRDMSVNALMSKMEFFCSQMNVNRRQLVLNLNGNSYMIQAGAMQWIQGSIKMDTGIKPGKILGKMMGAAVTGETMAKPIYSGMGQMMLEPTYRHILLTDLDEWNGNVVLDDGLFLACDAGLEHKIVKRSNVATAVLGGEGIFNLSVNGRGILALESIVPKEEIIEITLQNDMIKIDGNMAMAWSGSLDFTVEKSAKSLIGSAVSGEGFVNVYRGTGKIWMAPLLSSGSAGETNTSENASEGNTGSSAGKGGTLERLEKLSSFLDKFK